MTSVTSRGPSTFASVAGAVNDNLERHFWRWAALFVLVFFSISIIKDIRSKMWMDELFTFYVAKQANATEIVKAIAEGCDGAPPLYSTIVHSILPLVKSDALAVRLPATLGYCGMIVCLLAFCHRRLPAVYALFAAVLTADICRYYSTEGRPYGVVLGCVGAALLCWQMATEGRHRPLAIALFALFAGLMTAMHYYAFFFLVPIFLAEVVRARQSGKVDFALLGAMFAAPVVLALHYPLITASKGVQAHFWSPASWQMIWLFYDQFLIPVLAICPIALALLAILPTSRARETPLGEGFRIHEWVALSAIALMPALVVAVSIYTTHIFVDRYVIWTVMGFAVLAAGVLWKATRAQPVIGLAMLGVVVFLIAGHEQGGLRRPANLRFGQGLKDALAKLPDNHEPIVVQDWLSFIELNYYGDPETRARIVYPFNIDLQNKYVGSDTAALIMVPLSRRLHFRIENADHLLADYPRFLLSGGGLNDFLTWYLASIGCRVAPAGMSSQQPVLFEVEAPKSAMAGSELAR